MTTITRYKFFRLRDGEICSSWRNVTWKIGEWQEVEETLILCYWGLHCSEKPLDAFLSVPGEIIARVECQGASLQGVDKQAWQRMRLIKAWHWRKEDSVALAAAAARITNYDEIAAIYHAVAADADYTVTAAAAARAAVAYAAYDYAAAAEAYAAFAARADYVARAARARATAAAVHAVHAAVVVAAEAREEIDAWMQARIETLVEYQDWRSHETL